MDGKTAFITVLHQRLYMVNSVKKGKEKTRRRTLSNSISYIRQTFTVIRVVWGDLLAPNCRLAVANLSISQDTPLSDNERTDMSHDHPKKITKSNKSKKHFVLTCTHMANFPLLNEPIHFEKLPFTFSGSVIQNNTRYFIQILVIYDRTLSLGAYGRHFFL